MIEIAEGLAVDWADTVCRRALERGITYTDDVAPTFPDSPAGRDLELQTYVSVPLHNSNGEVEGTLCAASSRQVALGQKPSASWNASRSSSPTESPALAPATDRAPAPPATHASSPAVTRVAPQS